jgi:DNA mismatch endonuclease (patch repair protein)
MPDVHTPEVRSRNMSAIRGADTKPELLIRSGLHRRGFRYRLHDRELPGRPDIVLPKHGAVLFVHGCFWHGHDCSLFRLPATRTEFWKAKINGNRERDRKAVRELSKQGWRVGEIWECALKGPDRLDPASLSDRCAAWLLGPGRHMMLRGKPVPATAKSGRGKR